MGGNGCKDNTFWGDYQMFWQLYTLKSKFSFAQLLIASIHYDYAYHRKPQKSPLTITFSSYLYTIRTKNL